MCKKIQTKEKRKKCAAYLPFLLDQWNMKSVQRPMRSSRALCSATEKRWVESNLKNSPAGTKRCFNVQITLYGRYECKMNVEMTLCACWVIKNSFFVKSATPSWIRKFAKTSHDIFNNWRQNYFQFEEMQCRVFILPIIVLCFSLVKYDVHILFDDNKVLHTIF